MPSPSQRPGMGATPYQNGVTFRVWAPHADRVHVAGCFNQWSETSHELGFEGNGLWSLDIDQIGPGAGYKFFITNGDRKFTRMDPYATEVTWSQGHALVSGDFDWDVEFDHPFQIANWNELVIYELHIGTFHLTGKRLPANIDTVIKKLPYLRSLGINAIETMPPAEFAADISWGYNPANIFAVESAYKGTDAFKRFVRAAHRHGIAVIVDVVYNHFGPSDLDLWQFDGYHRNNMGGIYFYNDSRAHTPWGNNRPHYNDPMVRKYILDNVVYWLKDVNVDGLRWDATNYIRNVKGRNDDFAHDLPDGWSLMAEANQIIDQYFPGKISIAEDMQNNAWLNKPSAQGGAGFDTQWDQLFVRKVRQTLIAHEDRDRDMYAIKDAIEHRYNGDVFERIIFTESHDEVANGKARVPEEIWSGNAHSWHSKKRSTLGATLVFTSPGIPQIFMGQEFMEDKWFRDTQALDWRKLDRFCGIWSMYRDLIYLRRNIAGTTRGLTGQSVNVFHINQQDKVIAFHRWHQGGEGDDVVVVLNFSHQAFPSYHLGLPRGGWWHVRFNSDWQGYDPAFTNIAGYDTFADDTAKDQLHHSANIGIGPYSALILSQDPA